MESNNVKTQKSEYRLYSYLLIILSLFIVLFVTRGQLYNLNVNVDAQKEINKTIEAKQGELDDILSIKESIENGEISKEGLDKFLIEYNENDILDFFYNEANKKSISINSITLGESATDEFGFNEAKIIVNAEFVDEAQLLEFITYINSSNTYNFYTHSLSYDFGKEDETLKVTIPVILLYK